MPDQAIPLIFLIGYRGSGKTRVAKLLAGQLGWQWLDADEALVHRCGRSIRTIFAEEGEAGFRDRESALLQELCERRHHVIATGGGVILRETNRAKLRQAGTVVWLTADAASLWQRIRADAATSEQRPNLTVGGFAEIEQLLEERKPWYEACADIVVDTANLTPEAVANQVLAQFDR